MMTLQQVFDKVARHLLTQGVRATAIDSHGDTRCAYRGADGTRCAAGVLITDDIYYPGLEWHSVQFPGVADALAESGVSEASLPLVDQLQSVHDNRKPTEWPEYLRHVATENNLSPAVLDEFAVKP